MSVAYAAMSASTTASWSRVFAIFRSTAAISFDSRRISLPDRGFSDSGLGSGAGVRAAIA